MAIVISAVLNRVLLTGQFIRKIKFSQFLRKEHKELRLQLLGRAPFGVSLGAGHCVERGKGHASPGLSLF